MTPPPIPQRNPDLQRHYPFHLTPCPARDYVDLLGPALGGTLEQRPRLLHSGCRYGEITLRLASAFAVDIVATSEDTEGLLYARMVGSSLHGPGTAQFRFMSPLRYDFPNDSFDVVLLDGILATHARPSILLEAHRVLIPGGTLIVFDSYWRKTPPPAFVAAAWDSLSNKTPDQEGFLGLIADAGFSAAQFTDTSKRLKEFYGQFREQAREIASGGFEGMKHRKALVKQYKHEIDVFGKNGGDAYMGYCAVTARKAETGPAVTSSTDLPNGGEDNPP